MKPRPGSSGRLPDDCEGKKITSSVRGLSRKFHATVGWVYQQDDPIEKRRGITLTKKYVYRLKLRMDFCGPLCTRVVGKAVWKGVTIDWKEWKTKKKRVFTEHTLYTMGKRDKWEFPFDMGDPKATRRVWAGDAVVAYTDVQRRDDIPTKGYCEIEFSARIEVTAIGYVRP